MICKLGYKLIVKRLRGSTSNLKYTLNYMFVSRAYT